MTRVLMVAHDEKNLYCLEENQTGITLTEYPEEWQEFEREITQTYGNLPFIHHFGGLESRLIRTVLASKIRLERGTNAVAKILKLILTAEDKTTPEEYFKEHSTEPTKGCDLVNDHLTNRVRTNITQKPQKIGLPENTRFYHEVQFVNMLYACGQLRDISALRKYLNHPRKIIPAKHVGLCTADLVGIAPELYVIEIKVNVNGKNGNPKRQLKRAAAFITHNFGQTPKLVEISVRGSQQLRILCRHYQYEPKTNMLELTYEKEPEPFAYSTPT